MTFTYMHKHSSLYSHSKSTHFKATGEFYTHMHPAYCINLLHCTATGKNKSFLISTRVWVSWLSLTRIFLHAQEVMQWNVNAKPNSQVWSGVLSRLIINSWTSSLPLQQLDTTKKKPELLMSWYMTSGYWSPQYSKSCLRLTAVWGHQPKVPTCSFKFTMKQHFRTCPGCLIRAFLWNTIFNLKLEGNQLKRQQQIDVVRCYCWKRFLLISVFIYSLPIIVQYNILTSFSWILATWRQWKWVVNTTLTYCNIVL